MTRQRIFSYLILLSVTLACMTVAPETRTPFPTAFVVIAGPVAPPTATIDAINPIPSASPVLPTVTGTEIEYRVRVEISTGSDWTNLEILNSEVVRDAKITAEDGEFTNHTAAPNLIAMNQTLGNAQAGKTITLHVDLIIDANTDTLEMILKKGSIGLATLRFYKQSGAGDTLIQEVTHYLVSGDTSGLNPLKISIPLNKAP